jgi:seryl-tRNA synthetase
MIDINLIRENPDLVKENIKKKCKENKIPLVDEFIVTDNLFREKKQEADALRQERNAKSDSIGLLMREQKKDEAEQIKEEVRKINEKILLLEEEETNLETKRTQIWKQIPNIIDDDVPLGSDECSNCELKRFGEPITPSYDIPYHTDIMENLNGIDLDSAREVAGSGFYYLTGNIARLESAILTYARDYMIDKGFIYVIPPFMLKRNCVEGVMSFEEMDAMVYRIHSEEKELEILEAVYKTVKNNENLNEKLSDADLRRQLLKDIQTINGQELYLIGTSEHSMIARYINKRLDTLPLTLTSYSPCFRKEKGAHGLEERGVYRIHQFEKQEMIVICEPKDSKEWFNKMYMYTVDFFKTLDIPVRTLECCSGDLADLKCKSVDVEAWSPRQQKYFEVGSCSNLGDAQARRLNIKMNDGAHPHTLNNTVVAPPRMLIAFLENNYNEDGSINIPVVLRPYMGGLEKIQ